jgi:hypothetical protein
MQRISITAYTFNRIIQGNDCCRLIDAMRMAQLDTVPSNHPQLPPEVRQVLLWAKLEQRIPKALSAHILYFLIVMLCTALFQQTLLWIIVGSVILLMIPIVIFALHMKSNKWVIKQLTVLVKTPFLFEYNDHIYENLPNFLRLGEELKQLQNSKQQARNRIQKLDSLILQLKEKLILLGESTNDKQIIEMEMEQHTQQRIIDKTEQLIIEISRKYKNQQRIYEQLIERFELQALRNKANSLTNDGSHTQSLQQLTEIEMHAMTMSIQITSMQQELEGFSLHEKTNQETKHL